jgi:hypothetical protein
MLISRLFPHATHADPAAITRRGETWKENTRDLPWARVGVIDWWPLLVAGVVLAFLL